MIFVVTKDDRLKLALQQYPKLKIVRDYDEFEKYNIDYFKDNYFLSRLKEEMGEEIKAKNIEDIWLNIEENWVIKSVSGEKTYFIEIDFLSREVLGYTDFNFPDYISNFKSTASFASTHAYIEKIKDYSKYFSNEEIQSLIQAASANDQIYTISDDPDVKDFFETLYKAKKQIIPENIKQNFENYFKTA